MEDRIHRIHLDDLTEEQLPSKATYIVSDITRRDEPDIARSSLPSILALKPTSLGLGLGVWARENIPAGTR